MHWEHFSRWGQLDVKYSGKRNITNDEIVPMESFFSMFSQKKNKRYFLIRGVAFILLKWFINNVSVYLYIQRF